MEAEDNMDVDIGAGEGRDEEIEFITEPAKAQLPKGRKGKESIRQQIEDKVKQQVEIELQEDDSNLGGSKRKASAQPELIE